MNYLMIDNKKIELSEETSEKIKIAFLIPTDQDIINEFCNILKENICGYDLTSFAPPFIRCRGNKKHFTLLSLLLTLKCVMLSWMRLKFFVKYHYIKDFLYFMT